MKPIFFLLFALLSLAACKHEDDEMPPDTSLVPIERGEGVFILNEGAFNAGNASVDFFRYPDNRQFSNIYETQNGQALGDVLQSMTLFGDRAFLVVNNSQKIVVVDPADFKGTTSIGPFPSPRYLLPLPSGKAYLSDLFSNFIYRVDLANLQKIDSIAAGGWTEEMVRIGGEIFVANRFTKNIYVIDTLSNQMVDTLEVGFDPASMAVDINGKLWVLCSGDSFGPELGGIWRLDPATRQVEAQFGFTDFDTGTAPKIRTNSVGNVLYFLKKDIFKMGIEDGALPSNPIVSSGGRTLYALEIHPITSEIFTSDAVDFAQRGTVYLYSHDGVEIQSMEAGVAPNGFLFY